MQNPFERRNVVCASRSAAVFFMLTFFVSGALAQTSSQSRGQVATVSSQNSQQNSQGISSSKDAYPGPLLFGKGFLRGYANFELAPPHNEPDLGRCNLPQQPCSAFARYMASGYVEFQPFARTPLRHAYFFFEPRFFFGNNIPQISYTYSMRPLAWERTLGLAIALPRHFELRITNHGVTSFSPFDKSLGTFDYGPNKEPLGIYNTVGVRWYFGGYGHSSSSW
ncbi:MAG TPA: hypothetical protein VGR93_09020 [Candidatus Acidoferrales bacterium]|nr:hypothetical protein [Candidatus Acidoferrales bacterium]